MPRLAELLARNLGCSRTEARRLLGEGLVTSEGATLTDHRQEVAVGTLVEVEGEPLALHEVSHVMMNKPAGCITALEDERHPVAYSLLRDAPLFPELRPVGRLDLD